MKLPSLPDLDLDDNLEDLENFEDEIPNKKPAAKRKLDSNKEYPAKSRLPKVNLPSNSDEDVEKEVKKEKPKIPKSQYDSDGNPLLTIPDLDDIDLSKEIDRFFD